MNDTGSSRVGAWDAVFEGLGAGWDRMVHLLFRGPAADIRSWCLWGLILLIAAPTGGGSYTSNWDVPDGSDDSYPRFPSWEEIEPWMIAVGLAVLLLLVGFGLVWAYFQCRFRFVMLEGVRRGRPQIRGVFGTTGRVGLHYFLLQLGMFVAWVLLTAPLMIPWIPIFRDLAEGSIELFPDHVTLFVSSLLWFIGVSFAGALVQWWIYDLTLPYVWLGRLEFREGLARAWSLTRERFGAILAFLLFRFLIGVAGVVVACMITCLACVVWIWPLLAIIGLAMVAIAAPPAWLVVAPVMLVLMFLIGWISSTILAPIPLFYRSWSCAFVNQLDPSLPLWNDENEPQLDRP